jgi:O-antigen/teichoic acid export membrane protein
MLGAKPILSSTASNRDAAGVTTTPASRTNHAHNAVALAAGRMGASLLSLVTAMVLSRLLSQQHYGTYQQVWLVYNTLLPFVLFGLPASVMYFVPQQDARGQKMIVVQTTILLVLAGIAISFGAYNLSGLLSGGVGAESLRPLLAAFSLFPVFTLPITFVDSLLVATGQPRAAGWFNLLSAAAQLAAVAVPVALGHSLLTVMYLLSAYAVLRFTAIAVFVLSTYRGVPLTWSLAFVRTQLRYSLPLGLASLVGSLALQLDRIMISAWFSPREYAIYVNGATELPFVGIISGSVISVITPEFVRLFNQGRTTELLRLWHSATRKVALVFFPLTALLMALGPDVVVMLFSARYAQSAPMFRIFLILLPLRITVYGTLLMAAGRSTLILGAAVATLLLNVLLNLVLIPTLHLEGPALATVLATYFMGIWQLVRCARVLNVTFTRIFPWTALARLMLASCSAAAVTWIAVRSLPMGGVRLGAGCVVFVAAALPFIGYVGAREEFASLIRRRA